MKKLFVFLCFVFLVFAVKTSFAQIHIDSTEISSSVPELSDFHKIIAPMWHQAYPDKDMATLKGYVPQIKESMKAINNAILPGILKDKEDAWKSQLKEFNAAAENYYRAAEGTVDDSLLVAAEKLHFNYEMMNRVIRPVIKEIDAFHQVLYVIYHKLYPDKKYDEIAGLMDNLIEKADAIQKVPVEKLKKRLGDNVSKYNSVSEELYKATVSLKETLKGSDLKAKDEAIEAMHSLYQRLESVFE